MTPMMRRNAAWLPSVFNDLFETDFMPKANCTAPAINVKESDKAYIVELAAPGMKKEDFNVHINDEGNLIIKMEQKEEKKEEDKNTRYLRREFSYSKFEQTLILPDDVQKVRNKAVDHIDSSPVIGNGAASSVLSPFLVIRCTGKGAESDIITELTAFEVCDSGVIGVSRRRVGFTGSDLKGSSRTLCGYIIAEYTIIASYG